MDDQRRDGGTNSTLRTKEQGRHLTLNEHDDVDIFFHWNQDSSRTVYFATINQYGNRHDFPNESPGHYKVTQGKGRDLSGM